MKFKALVGTLVAITASLIMSVASYAATGYSMGELYDADTEETISIGDTISAGTYLFEFYKSRCCIYI